MKSSLLISKSLAVVSIVSIAGVFRADLVHAGTCADFAAPVWSYTSPPGTEVIFTGTTDPDGNLYWFEYQPALGSQQLVSARRDGSIRYRSDVERAANEADLGAEVVWADGFALIASADKHVRAFDANTGELAWDAVVSPSSRGAGAITDTGTNVIVVAYGDKLTGIDLASGQKLWTHSGGASISNGSGDIFLTERDNGGTLLTRADSSGKDIWTESAGGFLAALVGDETPLLDSNVLGGDIVVRNRWWELPGANYTVVAGSEVGFLVTQSRYGEGLLKSFSALDGSIIGEQTLSRRVPYGYSANMLLARDHLLLIWQETGPCPCLCHPMRFLQAKVSAWSETAEQVFRCDLTNIGEASVGGVSLYSGSLVIGRYQYISTSCYEPTHAQIIEAYGVPGEELADQGWVERWGGNPGQTRRPLR